LVIECAARTGVTIETMTLLLGPFVRLCETLARALVRAETRVEDELVAIVRRLRIWQKHIQPDPLHMYSAFCAYHIRMQLVEDVRSTVELDAVHIAERKVRFIFRRNRPFCVDENGKTASRKYDEIVDAENKVLIGSLEYASWDALVEDEYKVRKRRRKEVVMFVHLPTGR
jgi:hypothetical protein